MKLKKQLRKLQELLDDEARQREQHRQDLKDLLHKMRMKERKLSDKAKCELDESEHERIKQKIDILHAQRLKGILALRDLTDLKH